MKFKFVKENEDTKTFICDNDSTFDFDYIKMINILYYQNNLETSEFEGEFTDDEKNNIEEMTKELAATIIASGLKTTTNSDSADDN